MRINHIYLFKRIFSIIHTKRANKSYFRINCFQLRIKISITLSKCPKLFIPQFNISQRERSRMPSSSSFCSPNSSSVTNSILNSIFNILNKRFQFICVIAVITNTRHTNISYIHSLSTYIFTEL